MRHVTLFQRLLGVHSETQAETRIQPLRLKEVLLVNVGSTSTGGQVQGLQPDAKEQATAQMYYAIVWLKDPVCTSIGEKIALSRKIADRWRLVGWAVILKGETVQLLSP
jgi:translation initiation factor 2 subunit 3